MEPWYGVRVSRIGYPMRSRLRVSHSRPFRATLTITTLKDDSGMAVLDFGGLLEEEGLSWKRAGMRSKGPLAPFILLLPHGQLERHFLLAINQAMLSGQIRAQAFTPWSASLRHVDD